MEGANGFRKCFELTYFLWFPAPLYHSRLDLSNFILKQQKRGVNRIWIRAWVHVGRGGEGNDSHTVVMKKEADKDIRSERETCSEIKKEEERYIGMDGNEKEGQSEKRRIWHK